MKINKLALKITTLYRADCLQGKDIKDGAQLLHILKEEAERIKSAQEKRAARGVELTLAEKWGIENIIALLSCIE